MSIGGSLSGISFTGLASGIDSQSIIGQLMQIEALPLQRMQQQQALLSQRQSLLAQFKSILVGFNSSASALNTALFHTPASPPSGGSAAAKATLRRSFSTPVRRK